MTDVTGSWFAVVNSGWFGTLIGVLGIIVGIAFSVILHRRSKVTPQIRYAIADEALVNSVDATDPGRLEFRFDGNVVQRVTSTSVGVWNAGNTTFRRDDVVASDALRLMLPADGTSSFLQGSVEATSRDVNDVKIGSTDANALFIDFDFLDPGDGFRLRLIHSGSPGAMTLEGTIRGLPQGLTSHLRAPNPKLMLGLDAAFIVVMCVSALAAAISTILTHITDRSGGQLLVFGLATLTFCGLLVAAEFVSRRRRTLRRLKGIPAAISEDDVLYSRLQ